jgi:hypothetical protein
VPQSRCESPGGTNAVLQAFEKGLKRKSLNHKGH